MSRIESSQSKSKTGVAAVATTLPKARANARKPPVLDRGGVASGTPDVVSSSVAPSTTTSSSTPTVSGAPASSSATTAAGSLGASPTTTTASAAAPASSSSAAVSTTDASSDIPVMSAPPVVTMPSAPAGFVPIPSVDLRGYRPLQSEVACIPDAILEISTLASWVGVFGMTAPPSSEVASRLSIAMAWSAYLEPAQDWLAYVKSQEGMAWKDALLTLDELKPAFKLASTNNPSVLKQYPALTRLLGAQAVVTKRAVSTRTRAAKATAKANAATVAALPTANADATTATSSTSQTASAASGAAATVGRVVTVQG